MSYPLNELSQRDGAMPMFDEPEEDLSKVRELVLWIKQVQFHAKSSGYEDQWNLQQLGKNIPVTDICSTELEEVFEAIEEIADKKIVNLSLYAKTTTALISLSQKYPNIVVIEVSQQSSPPLKSPKKTVES